jgi:DNA-binding LacI/PurR family transcriptional regulator
MIDIANLAKVSRTAVTHVLTGAGRGKIGGVSQAKAEEIRRIAAELGYVPNLTAQQLAGKRSRIVGVIVSQWWSTESRFFTFLQDACASRGLDILAVQSKNRVESVEQIVDNWLGRGVEAVIILALVHDAIWTQAAHVLARFPHVISVVVDPEIEGSLAIKSDIADGMRQAVEYLHRQGRKKILLLLEDLEAKMNRLRHEAFLHVMKDLGCKVRKDQLCLATKGWSDDNFPEMQVLVDDLVRRGVDAILGDTDFTAVMICKALLKRGMRVPEDIAVVGWGNEIVARWANPLVTTVGFEHETIATACLDMLTACFEGSADEQLRSKTIPMKLVIRESA